MVKNSLLISLLFLLAACSKNKSGSSDRQPPVIQLSAPADNQSFTAGQTVIIAGAISDNDKIAEIHVHISNNTTGQLLIDIHRFPGAATYTLNESFTAAAGIPYKIQIIAIDQTANQQIQTVTVTGN